MDHATGARLRDAREQRGLTPDEVASAIGIPPEAVTDIEQGDALRHYGPGLAAAWTWAVGRHLGVAIDHELATWQPPSPNEPATGQNPGPAPAEPGGTADRPGEPSGGGASEADESAFREPQITPGWLADYDHDPLESFDPSSTERRETPDADDAWIDEPGESDVRRHVAADDEDDSELSGERTTGAHGGGGGGGFDEAPASPDRPEAGANGGETVAHPVDPWPESDDLWTQPEDDLWGPDDAFATIGLHPAEASSEAPGAAPSDEADAAGSPEPGGSLPNESHPEAPGSSATESLTAEPPSDDTGELPAADADTRVLAYTEGDEAAPLTAPSRARTVGAVLAALVVLVGAGVGVGALAAQLLDAPEESSTRSDDDEVDLAGDSEQDTDAGDAADEDVAGSDGAADEDPDGSGDSGDDAEAEIDGDPAAAADPSGTTVQILDGSADDGRYTDAQETLEDLGYQLIASGPAASGYDETTVFVTDGFADEAAALAEADERFAHLQPNNVGLSEDVELHVIVGGDWPNPEDG